MLNRLSHGTRMVLLLCKMLSLIKVLNVILVFMQLGINTSFSDGVFGCGGFVKSNIDINFSLVKVSSTTYEIFLFKRFLFIRIVYSIFSLVIHTVPGGAFVSPLVS